MSSFDVTVDPTQIALIILTNIKYTAGEEFGNEFRQALQIIRCTYKFNHIHDDNSINDMLKELARADAVRKLSGAPPPSTGSANAVASSMNHLTNMLKQQLNTYGTDNNASTYLESAAAATSDSDSSYDTKRSRGCSKALKPSSKSTKQRSASRGRIINKSSKNPCPYCREYK